MMEMLCVMMALAAPAPIPQPLLPPIPRFTWTDRQFLKSGPLLCYPEGMVRQKELRI